MESEVLDVAETPAETIALELAIERMTRDMKKAADTITPDEARFLVDSYYARQQARIRSGNQVSALSKSGEPHIILSWISKQEAVLERSIAAVLDRYSKGQPLGRWARAQLGIGPVLSAGLLAHINLDKTPTVSALWAFAGLDPTKKWEKGEKRPWNASLKTLCWKIGESFVKVSGKEKSLYGRLWKERKEQEEARNAEGKFKEQADAGAKRVGKTTEAYGHYIKGVLPPGHIHARAKRWAVKIFLSHYWERGMQLAGKEGYPKPYVFDILGHKGYIPVPPGE